MRVVSAREMGNIDRYAIEEFGIPGVVLMENAGRNVIKVIRDYFRGDFSEKRVTVVCGKGNNGGDGFVIARHLVNKGVSVNVFMAAKMESIKGDALINLQVWQRMGAVLHEIDELNRALRHSDLVVDALFGTGFKGEARGIHAEVIRLINDVGKPVVAVDLPSGLEADTGKVFGPCVKAEHTVTFALPKLGLILYPGADFVGELHVADISIPNKVLDQFPGDKFLTTPSMVDDWLTDRPRDSHKGDYGRAFILAGSPGMTGAAVLSAEGALRSGAGLVTLGIPSGLNLVAEAKLTEAMTLPLAETADGTLSFDSLDLILEKAAGSKVLAIGPGLSVNRETVELVREVIPTIKVPCVLDADGLNAMAGDVEAFAACRGGLVITPHAGEMARLMGLTSQEVQNDRVNIALQAAEKFKCVVLLKGARTLVAGPGGELYINTTGNPGMATGGSGDVLTGIIAGLIAQGMDLLKAAAAGAWIHGRAGDLAARDLGYMALTAGDILKYLPEVLQ